MSLFLTVAAPMRKLMIATSLVHDLASRRTSAAKKVTRTLEDHDASWDHLSFCHTVPPGVMEGDASFLTTWYLTPVLAWRHKFIWAFPLWIMIISLFHHNCARVRKVTNSRIGLQRWQGSDEHILFCSRRPQYMQIQLSKNASMRSIASLKWLACILWLQEEI